MDISKKLVEARKKLNISQYRLSKISGISQAGLSDIELGKKQPTIDTMNKILIALNLTWGEFFSSETPLVPPELINLMNEARELTPDQVNKLTDFIKSMRDK